MQYIIKHAFWQKEKLHALQEMWVGHEWVSENKERCKREIIPIFRHGSNYLFMSYFNFYAMFVYFMLHVWNLTVNNW